MRLEETPEMPRCDYTSEAMPSVSPPLELNPLAPSFPLCISADVDAGCTVEKDILSPMSLPVSDNVVEEEEEYSDNSSQDMKNTPVSESQPGEPSDSDHSDADSFILSLFSKPPYWPLLLRAYATFHAM